MKALHCYEPQQHQEKLIQLVARIVTREMFEEKEKNTVPVHLHGSLILQEVLHFNKPIKVRVAIIFL